MILEQSIDNGPWTSLGPIESAEELQAAQERIKMGSHAIMGGQYTCKYRLREQPCLPQSVNYSMPLVMLMKALKLFSIMLLFKPSVTCCNQSSDILRFISGNKHVPELMTKNPFAMFLPSKTLAITCLMTSLI